jgi:tetratricopeptide (TPR) repeat protein
VAATTAWGTQIDIGSSREAYASPANGTGGANQAEASDQERQLAEQLIKQLGSASFAERQAAIEQLWQLGPAVAKPLENALNAADPEVVKRTRLILDAFEMGLDASTPRSTALTVLYFENGSSELREQIIRNLESQYDYRMIFDLLSRIKDPNEQKALYSEEISLDSTIYRLASQERWDVIDQILNHEITWAFDFQLCAYYAQLNGTLETKIAELKSSINRDADEQKTGSSAAQPAATENKPSTLPMTDKELGHQKLQSDLTLLIRLLRITGQRREALEFTEKLDSPAVRSQISQCLLMELGDWKALETELTDLDSNAPAVPGQIATTLAQRALVHFFAGNREGFENVIARMMDRAKEPSAPDAAQIPAADLMDVLLIATDWDRASKYMDHENRLEMFQLYSLLQRNDEGLQSLGLTDDVGQRITWFERLAKRLQSVFRQYERSSSERSVGREINQRIGIPNVEEDLILRKADSIFQLGLTVAQQLGSLGFTDEAVLHLRTLADRIDTSDPGSQEKRLQILEVLVDMSEFEQAWQLIDQRFSQSEYQFLLRYLFPDKSQQAEYWWNVVSETYPDLLNKLKATASILNSPLQTPDVQVDLENVLAMVDGSLSSASRTTRQMTYYQIAMVYFFHGNLELSQQYLVRAAEERNYLAENFLADTAFESENFDQASEIFDRLWKRTISSESNTYAAAAAAVCFERLGDLEKARQRKLVAFASWLDSYRTESIISQFESRDCGDRILPILKASVYATPGTTISNEFYRLSLASIQTDLEPAESVINWQIYLFNRLATSSASGKQFVANMATQLKRAEAMAKLQSGDVAAAAVALDQYDHFRPGDPEIAEKFIPILDERGHTDSANTLFAQIAAYYTQILSRYPDSPLHHNNYAWVCAMGKRRLEFARYHADLAVQSRPGNSSYLDTLAEILFQEGDSQRARQLSQQCLQIQPTKRHYQLQFLRFGGKL